MARPTEARIQAMHNSMHNKQFNYTFWNFFHPFVGELIEKLNKESLTGMLDPGFLKSLLENQNLPDPMPGADTFFTYFQGFYEKPAVEDKAEVEGFPKEIDLIEGRPYANYNWELFYHIPLAIAVHLSDNQRFAEAQRWFHFIFDPTSNDTSTETPARYWKFLKFRESGTQIDELLRILSDSDSVTAELRKTFLNSFEALKKKPFQPYVVARMRPSAFQNYTLMKYLDNLIAWGDTLFIQDTIESINEATQHYILAANILGERPQRIPRRGSSRAKTFAQLREQHLDPLGNTLVELEGNFPFNLALPGAHSEDSEIGESLFGIGRTLYFCIPRNEKLLHYWDLVDDRLFKIRHCMNIEGVVRQLSLFDPPIDPGMLVEAAAAGIDIGSSLNGLNQPISQVRCLQFIQKALELSAEVRSLGSALLSAVEKREGEEMALLRQSHEIKIQQVMQEVRFLQWKQAQESTEVLLRSRASALERYRYYRRLLGLSPDNEFTPDTLPLDRRELTEENFDETFSALVGQYDKPITLQNYPKLSLDSSPTYFSGYSGNGKVYLSQNENVELNVHLPAARDARLIASAANLTASSLVHIPSVNIEGHFWGIGGSSKITSGEKIAAVSKFVGDIAQIGASWEQDQAGMASRYASYERRADEWLLQCNLTTLELMQIGRQILVSLITEQAAHREYLNIQKQIEQSQEIEQYQHDKFTNKEFYTWMEGDISRLYYEHYRLAFDFARKAEQSMKRELMRPEVDATEYIKFNYWEGGRKGLGSGEALYLDIKRMEMAYHENNKREYELTKHVSLRQLNPLALLSLKATGVCEFTLPEWALDLDGPGHYMRRIKNVSLSIPSVVGPYTSINCTLSLLMSSLRKSSVLKEDEYARQGSEDDRFIDYIGTVQSIVTSTGNNDSGLFETNLHDERILPFEGFGVESTWSLELPADFRQFDYNTISDVIIHIRYTARPGSVGLKNGAIELHKNLVARANESGLSLLLSLQHEFPSEWYRFIIGNTNFVATVKRDHFSYIAQGKDIRIDSIQLYDIKSGVVNSITPTGLDLDTSTTKLNEDKAFELSLPEDTDVLVRRNETNVFMLIKYSMPSI